MKLQDRREGEDARNYDLYLANIVVDSTFEAVNSAQALHLIELRSLCLIFHTLCWQIDSRKNMFYLVSVDLTLPGSWLSE